MADLFSTNVLTGVVNSLQVPPSFLIDNFFPGTQTEQTEEIHFDVEQDVVGLAPFVSPLVEGKVMTNLGYTTKTFKPAYVKPKHVFSGNAPLKRWKGEPIGGNLDPMQRLQMQVTDHLTAHRNLINRRLELMAAQALQLGTVTVTGDQYPTAVIDYGRAPALSVALAGGNRWDQTTSAPLKDLQTWSELVLTNSGSAAVNVVMDTNSWKSFKEHASVVSRLTIQRSIGQAPTLTQNAITSYGGTRMGEIDGFNIWVYAGVYKDDTGTVTNMLTSGRVMVIGDIMGYKAFGAIQDEDAGFQAVPYYSKSWKTPDPGARYIMTQSAPLVVPYRPNAMVSATVL